MKLSKTYNVFTDVGGDPDNGDNIIVQIIIGER